MDPAPSDEAAESRSQPAASTQMPAPEEPIDFKKGQAGKTVVVVVLIACALGAIAFFALGSSGGKRGRQQEKPTEQVQENKPDYKEGCPCGCDHSTEMTDALASQGDAAAIGAIDETLAVIDEREEAGFVTEAMVDHRLRLLDLEARLSRELGVPSVGRAPRRETRIADLPAASDGRARVRAQLAVHGEATEIVRGREKLHRPSFRLAVSIENLEDREKVVERPEIRASLPFPVGRWYLAGSDGSPWDGRIAAGASAVAYAVGYLREGLRPGTEISATVAVAGLTIAARARARRHWTDPD